MTAKIFDGSVDSILQRNYGREEKIMKKLQAEGITDATGQKVKPKTFSKWFGGYIDLIIGLGLAFGLYIVYTIIMPMADSALGMTPKEKKEKKKSSTPRGSTKKKR